MISKLPISLAGGVDLFSDPAAIPEGFHQLMQNLAPRMNGMIGRRASLTFSQEVEPSWWHWDARTGEGLLEVADPVPHYYRWAKYLRPLKFIFDPNYGNLSMVLVTTGEVTVQNVTTEYNSGSFLRTASEQTVPAGTLLFVCLPGVMNLGSSATEPVLRCSILGQADRIPSLFTFNGTTYCVGGSNAGAQLVDAVRAGDDLNAPLLPVNFDYATNYFGSANGDFIPQGAVVVRDRVVYFIGPNLYFSDRQQPEVVGTTGAYDSNGDVIPSTTTPPSGTNFPAIGLRDIMVGANAQDNIIAVAEVSTSANGSPQQSVVMAWTTTNCYMILGEPLETTEGGNVIGSLQVSKLNVEAGCISQSSVCSTPYGTFWVGPDDVWFMPFGSLPIRVGTKIRPYLLNQPRGLLWRIHAEYVNGTYMVAMFRDGQGPSAWDPCNVHFWLDLKGGPPQDATSARWYGPQLINQTDCPDQNGEYGGVGGTYCFARDLRANGDGKTYTLQPYVIRDISDKVLGMSLCSFDTYDDKDTTAPQRPRTVQWQPSYLYYEGDEIVPQPDPSGGLTSAVYTVAVSGMSGLTEPDWYTPAGDGELVDGTVTWECKFFDNTGGGVLSGYDRPLGQEGATIGSYNNMIQPVFMSKEYIFEIYKEILLDGCEAIAVLGDAMQLTYNTHPDQDERSKVWRPDFVTTTTLDTTAFERRWQRILLTPSPTKRFNALSGVVQITQDAGIVITEGVNDTWAMTVGGTPYTITVPAGYYTNIVALSQALRTAYNTATGATLTTSLDSGPGFNTRATFAMKDAANTLAVTTTGELSQIFGFLEDQPVTSALANVDVVSGSSPAIRYVPDLLISQLFLRHASFNRDP